MESVRASAKSQRMQVGGPLGVLLVTESAPLLLRMAEVVCSIPGLRLAGSFNSVAQAIDWLVWDRTGWHIAVVDLALRQPGQELVQRLLAQPRPGTVVALGDHLWREVRAHCDAIGAHELLEKGDIAAFRGYLEARMA
jgi:DNA-binding NarL/FixJ family response regulator